MVKHLVMWRMRRRELDLNSVEARSEILRAIDAMRVGIAGLRSVELGFNRSRASDASDLALYSEFDTWEALQAYEIHPLHEALKVLIGPLRAERRVVDYETS
jgi:hypothetical protein